MRKCIFIYFILVSAPVYYRASSKFHLATLTTRNGTRSAIIAPRARRVLYAFRVSLAANTQRVHLYFTAGHRHVGVAESRQ